MKSPAPLKKKKTWLHFSFLCVCFDANHLAVDQLRGGRAEAVSLEMSGPTFQLSAQDGPPLSSLPDLPGLWTLHCSLCFDSSHEARDTQAVRVCFPPGASCWPLCPAVLEAAWAPEAGSSAVSLARLCCLSERTGQSSVMERAGQGAGEDL